MVARLPIRLRRNIHSLVCNNAVARHPANITQNYPVNQGFRNFRNDIPLQELQIFFTTHSVNLWEKFVPILWFQVYHPTR